MNLTNKNLLVRLRAIQISVLLEVGDILFMSINLLWEMCEYYWIKNSNYFSVVSCYLCLKFSLCAIFR